VAFEDVVDDADLTVRSEEEPEKLADISNSFLKANLCYKKRIQKVEKVKMRKSYPNNDGHHCKENETDEVHLLKHCFYRVLKEVGCEVEILLIL
jgi:hypothetical protein